MVWSILNDKLYQTIIPFLAVHELFNASPFANTATLMSKLVVLWSSLNIAVLDRRGQ